MKMEERKREKEVLPLDAVMNILKRVPVKSLMRFKCVSKEWLNLLEANPFFTKQQLEHSTRNPALLLQRFHRQPPPLSFSVCLIGPHYNLIHQSHLSHVAFPDAKILHSCNGLLCLRNNTDLSILNPATCQIRQVPTTTVMPFHEVGFGFSLLADDYKIVRISMCDIYHNDSIVDLQTVRVDQAEVYSLTSGSWREINAAKLQPFCLVSSSVAITGTIFWLASRIFTSGSHYEFVVSFDVRRELFTLMSGPPMPSSPSHPCGNVLAVCNDELAMFHDYIVGNSNSSFDLWVLKDFNSDYDNDRCDGGGESWMKMYSVGPFYGIVYPLSLWRDEIVCLKPLPGGDTAIALFDPVSKIPKQMQPDRDEFCYEPFTYVETLVPV
ncbi:hypothetical protein VNO80_28469 [Phaseolus coccineus]|uniref:F-box domain-containing protein n=1 Tax=Phaseolus coccineus TaxID=3886 RepID=A0AAN9QE16_PHACN